MKTKQFAVVTAALLMAIGQMTLIPAFCADSGERKAVRRLAPFVKPEFYDITLRPNLEKSTFSGTETVTIKVDKSVSSIWLHALELRIDSSYLTDAAGNSLSTTIKSNSKEEMVGFFSTRPLAPGVYKLHTTFSGTINDKLRGFYKASFKDTSGKTRTIASTQMEPADARRLIPCFDEPDMKARFKLTLKTLPKFSAVFNAPLVQQTVKNNELTIEFGVTPPMSSYLLALVVGELEATPEEIVQGVPIRVWSVKGMSHLGTYGRDEAARILPYLNSYFGIPYPWKKLDLIAVPDFAAGAMENPGAITFRETLLLLDPKTASTHAQKSATSVIAHEMAHLWFGDLVTMKWWDDLWLNEAFATWMATKTVDAVRPEWQMWKEYADARTAALDTDSLRSTRAIHSEVKSPEQTHEMFDVITYEKGASVLRMLERYVGELVFQKGVHSYLQSHAFGNATTGELWHAVGAAAGSPVNEIMFKWVHQSGYPLIRVEQSDKPGTWKASQQRFFALPDGKPNNQIWDAPIGLRSVLKNADQNGQSQAECYELLRKPFGDILIPPDLLLPELDRRQEPVLANAGGLGYFRVRYSDPIFAALMQQPRLNFDPSERLSLIDDSSALMVVGLIPVTRHLELLWRYKDETDEAVWSSIIGDLHFFDRYVGKDERKAYQKFAQGQLANVFARLGWDAKENESTQLRLLRASVISALGTIGQDQSVIAEARKRFAGYLKDRTSLDRDLLSPVSTIVAYNGQKSDYEEFRKLSKMAPTPEIRVRNLFVLDEFQSPELVAKTLDLALSKDVRLQDAPHLLGGLLRHRQMQNQAWNYITNNWQRICTLFPEDMVPGVVSSASSFSTPDQLAKLKSFLAAHPIPSGKATVARTIERATVNVQFRKNAAADLNKWLESNYGG